MLACIDGVSNDLCQIADVAELTRSAHPHPSYTESANEAVNTIASFMGEVNLDEAVYQKLLVAEEANAHMTIEQKTVLTSMCASMQFEGVHLPDEKKLEMRQLMEEEMELSFAFCQQQRVAEGVWIPENLFKNRGNY